RLERAGFKNNRYVIELYGKLANPLVNFVMILFGIAIALNSRVGGGMRAAGLGLLVVGAYFVIILVSTSLGNMGTLPPFLVPWVNPVVFGIAGCYMFLRIKE
ncbi:MAG: LptF/LptG family permease, partial [Thermodesulfobacteriota bacterium]